MQFKELIAVCSRTYETMCGQNAVFLMLKLVVHVVSNVLQRVNLRLNYVADIANLQYRFYVCSHTLFFSLCSVKLNIILKNYLNKSYIS
jgi:hypothetical protein